MARLKKEALQYLRRHEEVILQIAKAAKPQTVFRTVERWMRENKDDGPLTKISILEIIEEATGLTEDQIIERAAVAA